MLLSASMVLNIFAISFVIVKLEKTITEKQLMSFCMKNDIPDKKCKIPYQYKRS